MKLNNKGFAITTLLYGILILFVFLVGSYLFALSAKKNRIDNLIEEIEKDNTDEDDNLAECPSIDEQFTGTYIAEYEGTYIFNVTAATSGIAYDCSITLELGDSINYRDNTIYFYNDTVDNTKEETYAPFNEHECYDLVYHKDIRSVNSVIYICN